MRWTCPSCLRTVLYPTSLCLGTEVQTAPGTWRTRQALNHNLPSPHWMTVSLSTRRCREHHLEMCRGMDELSPLVTMSPNKTVREDKIPVMIPGTMISRISAIARIHERGLDHLHGPIPSLRGARLAFARSVARPSPVSLFELWEVPIIWSVSSAM